MNFENQNAFCKYSRIQEIKPVKASLGAQEGLKFDRKYLVFANDINEFGKVERQNIGTVKSMKVVDNQPGNETINDLSEFYQTGGKRISASGMYLEKKKDL